MFKNKSKRVLFRRQAARVAGSSIVTMSASFSFVNFAWSQTTLEEALLEEVIVTARKREESLISVPATVTAIDRDTITSLRLDDIKSIAELVPTLQTAQRGSGAGAAIYLRGVGSNSTDAAFDSAVALNLDGVVSNSARLISQGNLDMQQIEILKGPQSLYFGKGATAGVVSIKSADPGDVFEAQIKAAYETEEQGRAIEAFVSGPMTDTLGVRVAARTLDVDEIALNTASGVALPERGEQSTDARLTLAWAPSDRLTANLKFSTSEYENDGSLSFTDVDCVGPTAQQGVYPQASALASPILVAGGYDCDFGDQTIQIADQNSVVNQIDGQPGSNGGVPYSEQQLDLLRLDLNWQVSDTMRLSSVTSQLDLDEQGFDCFAYDTNGSNCIVTENSVDSFSQEVRLSGNITDSLSFMLGGFYQDRDLLHANNQDVLSVPVLLSFLAGSPLAARDPFTGFTIDWIKRHPTEHTTKSIFASLSWNIDENWNVTAGGRYSDEEKENFYQTPFVHAGLGALLPGAAAPSGFSVPISFADTNFSPEVTVSFKPSRNQHVYLAYKTGFKSGGVSYSQLPFLADYFALIAGDTSALEFESETAEGFELGFKSISRDGNLRLNASAYAFEIENFQNQQFDSTTFIFTTFNAGDIDNRGLELDVNYKTKLDGLSLRGAFAYTDTQYAAPFVNIAGVDLNGQPLKSAPEFSGNLGIDYRKELSNGMQALLSTTAFYTDDYITSTSQQGSVNEHIQDSFWRADIAASLSSADNRWTLALIGRNISDEIYTIDTVGRPGTVPNALGQQDQVHVINRGRQFFLEATYRF